MHLICRVSALVVLAATLSGCSVVMASRKRGVEVSNIMICRTEACVLALKDTEVMGSEETNDGRVVTYRSLQKQGSTGRAVMHGLLDVATLDIWEVAGTPIEAHANNEQYLVYRVIYDDDNNVIRATIEAAS